MWRAGNRGLLGEAPFLSVSQLHKGRGPPQGRGLPQGKAELEEHLGSAEAGTQVQNSPGLGPLVCSEGRCVHAPSPQCHGQNHETGPTEGAPLSHHSGQVCVVSQVCPLLESPRCQC